MMPTSPQAEGASPSVMKASTTSQMVASFHSEVTTPIEPYKSAFESASVAEVCRKPNRTQNHQKPGCISGTPRIHTASGREGEQEREPSEHVDVLIELDDRWTSSQRF